MNYKTFDFNRRMFLRGTGAVVGLPMLEAMMPFSTVHAQTGAEGQPIRFAGFFMPNGVNHGAWDPKGKALAKLPPSLTPLENFKEDLIVVTGIDNGTGAHNLGTSAFLTGRRPKKTPNPAQVNVGNASIDQIIGQAYKEGTTLPTLELGMSAPSKGVGMNGSSNVYRSFVSWKNATTPVPAELNPKRAFDRLFKGVRVTTGPGGGPSTALQADKSVLDSVLEDAKDLQKRLGKEDKQKLDEYLTAVREVEERIALQARAAAGLKITPEVMKGIRATDKKLKDALGKTQKGLSAVPRIPYREYGRLMMDVMALAFWSNSTAASTLMFGDGLHGRNMSFIEGVNGNHHSISHHGNKKAQLHEFHLINKFFASQMGYFMGRLKSMKEGGSNVLENSVILLGSNISSGQEHHGRNIPILIAGGGGGNLRGGKAIQAKVPIAQVHNAILDTVGVKQRVGGTKDKLRGV
ncbi:MAG: DUF1552 domain-containing protein [Verrucomicrobiales bacterium]|nr:DUF1552 domain-containing protein [Verrucomicrobiales bacterium]